MDSNSRALITRTRTKGPPPIYESSHVFRICMSTSFRKGRDRQGYSAMSDATEQPDRCSGVFRIGIKRVPKGTLPRPIGIVRDYQGPERAFDLPLFGT